MRDIICISTTDWDEIWGSRQQIMSRLAKLGNRILFVERQVGPEHFLRDHSLFRRKINFEKPLRYLMNNIWILNPGVVLPGRYYSNNSNNLSQLILSKRIQQYSGVLGFTSPLLWIYPPHSYPIIGMLNECLVVYHCIDKFSAEQKGRKRKIIESQEKQLLLSSDCIFTHAKKLKEDLEELTDKPVHLLPSAADVELFQKEIKQNYELGRITKPKLGVFGTFDGRIDSSLLLSIAINKPEWQIFLVGPVRPGVRLKKQLVSQSNIHFIGSIKFQDLPAYMQAMDVLLLPYVRNKLTEYINPLKIYEYLAIGKPVVSVPIPEIEFLKKWIYFASESGQFEQTIQSALGENDPSLVKERRIIAQGHDWDKRIIKIVNILAGYGIQFDAKS